MSIAGTRRTFVTVNLAVAMMLVVIAHSFMSAMSGSITKGVEALGSGAIIVGDQQNGFVNSLAGTGLDASDLRIMRDVLGESLAITGTARVFSDIAAGGRSEMATIHYVDPDFFSVTGVKLQSGRRFTSFDQEAREPVCLVSADLANRLQAPAYVRADGQDCRVIGVTSSEEVIPNQSLGLAVFRPRTTLAATTATGNPPVSSIFLKPQFGAPPADVVKAIAALLPPEARTRDMIWDSAQYWASRRQIVTGLWLLVSALSAVLVALAAAGLASTLSLNVLARRPEIGLRIALGATRRDIFLMMCRDGVFTAGAGGLAGALTGIVLAQLVIGPFLASTDLLLGTEMRVDVTTVAVAGVVLAIAALGATIGPSWRATTIDPTLALRNL